MFIGRYYHNLEEKGRLSLPKSFRELEKLWVITRGLDGGLFLFPKHDFEKQMTKISSYTFTKKAQRDFVRLMTNDAAEVEVDTGGRILIPEFLRASAQLTKELVVVGSLQRIEIWDVKIYHQYLDQLIQQAESIAEQVETVAGY